MSNWQASIGVVAGILSLVCFIPYIIAILQGKTQPNRATWWIWVTIFTVVTTSNYFAGAGNTLWFLVCNGIGQLIVAILSLKYGKGGWSLFDQLCLLGVGISLLLWWHLNSPLIAILLNILIDFLGALPTIKKSYHEPKTESLLSWSLNLVSSGLNLLAIEHWSIAISNFPVYIFLVNLTIVTFLLRPKIRVQLTDNWHRHTSITNRRLGNPWLEVIVINHIF